MNDFKIIVTVVFVLMTIVGFAAMGIDKKRAKNGQWRIKEASLFAIALLLGGVGGTVGMFTFRHKTQHWYFKLGFPLLALVNIAAYVAILFYL